MSDLESFRKETRDWLGEELPAGDAPGRCLVESSRRSGAVSGSNATYQSDAQRVWFERVRDKKWIVPHWPAEYGGGGLDPAHASRSVRQEMANRRAPPLSRWNYDARTGAAEIRQG